MIWATISWMGELSDLTPSPRPERSEYFRGDLANALKCYSRARDYCTSGRHVMSMCINVIKVSVYLQNWSHVISYVNKALATPELSEDNKVKNNEVLIVMTRWENYCICSNIH